MSQKPVRSIVIVGGGTAGWMAACYLVTSLGSSVRITLVESPEIKTVGVGEASFNTIKLFFDAIKLREEDWMPECGATYKLAIKFANWTSPGSKFYHPFQRFQIVDGFSLADWWLKLKTELNAPFDYSCFVVPRICDANCSPKYLDGQWFDDTIPQYVPYAYHFDAQLLARYLREVAIARGVFHVCDNVRDVRLSENGLIISVRTESDLVLDGELFIDCSGFRGLLINQTLKEPFISFGDSLLCDSAVAMRIGSDSELEGIEPYTTATALSSGWCWNIPLFHRVGTGYVYSSAFTSADKAEMELRRHLGMQRAAPYDASHIKMRIGRNRNIWVGNCVSIGLSAGFVEPLESTGIFFIQYAISELINHFPGAEMDTALIDNYNRVVGDCIDCIRDFLTLHYCTTQRTDTQFWCAAKNDLRLSPRLAHLLELWKVTLPNQSNVPEQYHGFISYSYAVMLLGLGHLPRTPSPLLFHKSNENSNRRFAEVQHRAEQLTSALPSHYDYLKRLYDQREICGLPVENSR